MEPLPHPQQPKMELLYAQFNAPVGIKLGFIDTGDLSSSANYSNIELYIHNMKYTFILQTLLAVNNKYQQLFKFPYKLL